MTFVDLITIALAVRLIVDSNREVAIGLDWRFWTFDIAQNYG